MERQLQDKLQAYSAPPPVQAWQKIADALDEEKNFSKRLYGFEAEPPAAAWQKIEKALEKTEPAPVVPFVTRFHKSLRYAAAASIIALVVLAITMMVNRPQAGAPETASNAAVQTKQAKATSPTLPAETAGNSANTARDQQPPNPPLL